MTALVQQVGGAGVGHWLPTAVTLLFFGIFLGFAAWAWHPANRERMRRAALIPFDEDEAPPGGRDAR